jgi:hypothetical protein
MARRACKAAAKPTAAVLFYAAYARTFKSIQGSPKGAFMGIQNRAPLQVGVPQEPRVLKVGRTRTEAGTSGQWDNTEATRYLCASAYLNRAFRNWVIRHFIEHKHIALEVSYGIDPVTILKHSLIARSISRTRNLLLFIPVVIVALGLFSSLVASPVGIVTLPAAEIVALLAAIGIIAWEQWKLEFKIVREKFTKKHFDPSIPARHFNLEQEQAFREIETAQKANVMIYAAFSPFVGCGNNIGSWSIPVDLTKGKEDVVGSLQPRPFELKDLYTETERAFRTLEFPNYAIEDKLCISGLDIRGEEKFLPDLMGRPCTRIESALVEEPGAESSMQARRYQTFRLVDWSGELILSTFLRFAKTGHNLFIEVSYCLLVPVDEVYRSVDKMNPVPSWQDWIKLLSASAIKSIFIWLAWPFYICSLLFHPLIAWLKEREEKKMIRENPAFNHGAVSSLREATCTSNVYRRYFQKLDREMYLKTLESQILTCIVEFLDERNIDTSSLKEAQTKIVNSGIILTGGSSLDANTLAVGHGSSAISNDAPGAGAVKFIKKLTGVHK